jgi:hypothetical protein
VLEVDKDAVLDVSAEGNAADRALIRPARAAGGE